MRLIHPHILFLSAAMAFSVGFMQHAIAAEPSVVEAPDAANQNAGPSEDEMRAAVLALYGNQASFIISTINEQGYPEARYVSNLRNSGSLPVTALSADSLDALIVTSGNSEKVRHILTNPNASIYFPNIGKQAVLLTGTLEVVKDENIRQAAWVGQAARFYPDGPKDPDYTILRFTAKTVKVHQGQGSKTIAVNAQ